MAFGIFLKNHLQNNFNQDMKGMKIMLGLHTGGHIDFHFITLKPNAIYKVNKIK